MTEAWLLRAAEEFWNVVQQPTTFPRDLAPSVSYCFPVSIVYLSKLTIRGVERWLTKRSVPYQFLCRDCNLCGCIVAVSGHALLFVDAEDSADEHRFTVAHEVAHFLQDYMAPRQRAITFLGESIRPVLDGVRPPTATERVDAILSNVKLGIYTDLMPRDAQGGIDQGSILRAEERADRLALELLAPEDEVLLHLPNTSLSELDRVRAGTDVLVNIFGVPRQVARAYAAALVRQTLRRSTSEWLGL